MTLEGASVIHASRHYERAGLRSQAFRAAMTGAPRPSRISARHEAYELYRRAIDNMPTDLPLVEQAELYERFSDAAAAIERNEDISRRPPRARANSTSTGGTAARCRGDAALDVRPGGARWRARGEVARVHATGHSMRSATCRRPRTGSRSGRSCSACAPTMRFVRRSSTAARADAEAARELADAVGDRETVLEADLTLARIDIVDGRYETGLRDGMRAAREAREAGFESVGVSGYRNLAIMAARVMDPRAAEPALQRRAPVRRRDRAVPLPPDDGDDGRADGLGRRPLERGRRARPA